MKNIINRSGSRRVTSFFRNAGSNYNREKGLCKQEIQKNQNNKEKGDKKSC